MTLRKARHIAKHRRIYPPHYLYRAMKVLTNYNDSRLYDTDYEAGFSLRCYLPESTS